MIGKRVEMLVVVGRLQSGKLLCKCDCGNERIIRTGHFNTGSTKSCGCHASRHGHCNNREKTREYTSYFNMIARCTKPSNKRYSDYGGKGIIVCDRWLESFTNFISDMGVCPDGMQIDRIDNNGNYEPSNCRWISPKDNMENRSVSGKYIVYGNVFFSASDAAKYFNVSTHTINAWRKGRTTTCWLRKAKKKSSRYYPPKEGCYFEKIY